MTHLPYTHSPNVSILGTVTRWIRQTLFKPTETPNKVRSGRVWPRVLANAAMLFLALAVQAALLILVSELVEVAHGVMELYLDLARQQLDLTSLYVAATGPQK